ncbi:hypothetical protein [Pseudanabaena sp. BC1403]|uniref:hypothetical protein n=1 Tax=Pseudanabaena sp. BC1403 TaxID=2043171 RepID=UPI002155FE82|nr:hypothetical protein [Pseudanabaena sp. BC1403]
MIIGEPIEDRSPVIGNNAPKRKVSLTPPPPELVAGDVAEVVLESVTVVLGWQATIQIVVTVASRARQSVEKNLLVMVTMDYDHIYEVAVIVSAKVSAKSHDIYH